MSRSRRRTRFSSYRPQVSPGGRFSRLKGSYARIAKLGFVAVILGLVGLFVVIPLFALTLPAPDEIVRREGFATKILDRNGEVLYDIFIDERRTHVPLEQIPETLQQATVAIEDKNFYNHGGYDPTAYARAIFNIAFRRNLQGGSTLTQQLVKNVLLTTDRTLSRKLREFVLALQIESKFSKDQILEMYLNEAPYGGTAWGVEAAAETYFGKQVGELGLVESAILAGMPQRPSVYSPYSSTPNAYVARTTGVLRRMREDGYITAQQEEDAVAQLPNVKFQPRGSSFKAPHFVQYVQNILEARYGEAVVQQGGLTVTTTLDLELQEEAQKIVAEEIEKVESLKIGNGAAVALDPQTGEILAMVGSKDFNDEENDGQVNVTLSLRQPGSAIKPFVYLTGIKQGYSASTLLMDVPTVFPGGAGSPDYEPVNYDGEYRGPIQLRYALGSSVNVPAVKMLALAGIDEVLETAFEAGITSLEPTQETRSRVGLSLALGGGEVRLLDLTAANSIFMNEGHRVEPVSILKVEDHNGKIIEESSPKLGRQVITPEQAYIIADILSDNSARELVFGPNSLLNIPGRQVAVKTGTTNDRRDNWTVGGNSQVVVGTWVGNNDNSPMTQVASGVTGASPIWRRIILESLEAKPNLTFQEPSGIVRASVDRFSGLRAHDDFPERQEIFIKGTEPGEDTIHLNLQVCRDREGLANPGQIASGDFENREFFKIEVQDPTAGPGQPNRWQEGVLNWIATLPEDEQRKYSPPTEFCDEQSPSLINVEFTSPRDRDSNLPNEFTVHIDVQSVHGIEEMRLEIDGVLVRTFTGPPFEFKADLADGPHELRAIARDNEGNESDRIIRVGVNSAWDESEDEGE